MCVGTWTRALWVCEIPLVLIGICTHMLQHPKLSLPREQASLDQRERNSGLEAVLDTLSQAESSLRRIYQGTHMLLLTEPGSHLCVTGNELWPLNCNPQDVTMSCDLACVFMGWQKWFGGTRAGQIRSNLRTSGSEVLLFFCVSASCSLAAYTRVLKGSLYILMDQFSL